MYSDIYIYIYIYMYIFVYVVYVLCVVYVIDIIKAGRFVGESRLLRGFSIGIICLWVLVLANNATFSLAASCTQSANRPRKHMCHQPQWLKRKHRPQYLCFFTCLCPLRHVRSERNCPISVLVEKATPMLHSLRYYRYYNI